MSSKSGGLRTAIDVLKGNVSTQLAKVEVLLKRPSPGDESELTSYIGSLQLAQASLKMAARRLQGRHDEWLALINDNPAVEQQLYDAAATELFQLLFASDESLSAIDIRISQDAPQLITPIPSSIHHHRPEEVQHLSRPNTFKIPKIKLPTFSGDYLEFKQFWGIFKANIHDRKDLSGIEKFSYLVSQLEGKAKKAIAGILIDEKTYDVAVKMLMSRFNRADARIVTMLYSQFSALGTSGATISEQQSTLDECEQILQQLESAGEDLNANKALVFGLLSKFPSELVRDLQRFYKVGPKSTLDQVREGLSRAIMDEETSASLLADLRVTPGSGAKKSAGGISPEGTSVKRCVGGDDASQWIANYGAGTQNGGGGGGGRGGGDGSCYNCGEPGHFSRECPHRGGYGVGTQLHMIPPRGCYFCDGAHFNGDCMLFPTATARLERLAEVGRCMVCMRSHSGACGQAVRCVHCRMGNAHPSPLCPERYPDTSVIPPSESFSDSVSKFARVGTNEPNDQAMTTSADGTNLGDVKRSEVTPSGGIAAFANVSSGSVLFPTTKVMAVNRRSGERRRVRLVLDTLSSRSYIREAAAGDLGLVNPGSRTSRLSISVFGSSESLSITSRYVEFDVTLSNGQTRTVRANTAPMICRSGLVNNFWSKGERKVLNQHRSSLADDPDSVDGTIDVLIGAGQVWEFIEGPRFATSAKGLYMIPSCFGLMLSGQLLTSNPDAYTMLAFSEPNRLSEVDVDYSDLVPTTVNPVIADPPKRKRAWKKRNHRKRKVSQKCHPTNGIPHQVTTAEGFGFLTGIFRSCFRLALQIHVFIILALITINSVVRTGSVLPAVAGTTAASMASYSITFILFTSFSCVVNTNRASVGAGTGGLNGRSIGGRILCVLGLVAQMFRFHVSCPAAFSVYEKFVTYESNVYPPVIQVIMKNVYPRVIWVIMKMKTGKTSISRTFLTIFLKKSIVLALRLVVVIVAVFVVLCFFSAFQQSGVLWTVSGGWTTAWAPGGKMGLLGAGGQTQPGPGTTYIHRDSATTYSIFGSKDGRMLVVVVQVFSVLVLGVISFVTEFFGWEASLVHSLDHNFVYGTVVYSVGFCVYRAVVYSLGRC